MSAAQRYWDDNAAAHTFTHPLNLDWLAGVPKDAHILDYGCGYGRTTAELVAAGWPGAVGVDFAAGMIARGRDAHPGLDLRHIDGLPLAEADVAFDAVLLFAVLTSIPDDGEQLALMAELRRLLKPGGLIYVSDYLLQTDDRHLARYQAGAARHGVYGVWDRDDGGVFRHHTRERLDELIAGFEPVAEREVATTTFSGAKVTAIQRLGKRAAA
jgi:SAM-dependent methyltransferase